MNDDLKHELESTFKDIRVTENGDGRLTVMVLPAQVLTVLSLLKGRGFDYLILLSAVDRMEDGTLELVYVLSVYAEADAAGGVGDKPLLIVKTVIARDDPRLKTAIGVFPNVEPYEREIHELFGVYFDGHPRLTPLFLEREYTIPPFRKDFDTRKYVQDVFDTIPPVGNEDK